MQIASSKGQGPARDAGVLQAMQAQAAQTEPSATQRLVAEALQDMGLSPEVQHCTSDPAIYLGLALPQQGVVVEVHTFTNACC